MKIFIDTNIQMIFGIWEMRKSRHISQQSRVGVCNTVLFQKSSGFVCLHKEGENLSTM